jgi:CHAD domain-containing protein
VATTPSTSNGSVQTFTATYLDTPDRRLARAGIPLRRRMEQGKSIWEAQIGETTVSAPGGPTKPPAELKRLLGALLRGQDLIQIARVRRGKNDVALLDGQRVLESYEGMDEALRHALDVPGKQAAPSTKAPALEHVRSFLRRQLDEIERHDPAVRLGSDPEDLHRMRVAVRRSRAALRAVPELFDDGQVRSLRAELKWLGGRLGPTRDLDVLLTRLREQVAELDGPDAVSAGKILAQLETEREHVRQELLAGLEEPRYAALLDQFEQFVAAPPVTGVDVSLERVAAREFSKLERLLKKVGPDSSNDELHRARIQAKRVRYSTELSLPIAGKGGRRVIAAAKSFQDVVGAHQDAVVAEERIRTALRRARGVGTGVAAGRLIERERARRSEARAALPAAWKQFRRRGQAAWS